MKKIISANGIAHNELTDSAKAAIQTQADLLNKIEKLERLNQITAHNLRGAAANIKMLAEALIEKKLVPGDRGEGGDVFTSGEAMQYIHESSISLLGTLGDLLSEVAARLGESAAHDFCDIRGIAEHVLSQLNGFVHQQKATIVFNLAVTHISYPKLFLESILYNLISNALKHAHPATDLKLVISTYSQNERTALSVKDNGTGIDLAAKGENLFSFSNANSQSNEGKGIGLYITRLQIESQGGSINVESALNEGSEFIAVL